MLDLLTNLPPLFVKSLLFATPLYFLMGKWIYQDWHDFVDSLRFLYQPSWLSLLRGEWHEDNWATLKFFFFLCCCLGCAGIVYKVLDGLSKQNV